VPAATLPVTGLVDANWAALFARIAPAVASRVAKFGPQVAAMAETILPLVPMDLLSTRVSAALPSLLEELRRLPITVDAALDPRLQLAVINRLTGKKGLALTSTARR